MSRTEGSLYLSDFLTGLLAALALEGKSTFSLRDNRLDGVLEKLVDDFRDEAGKSNLRLKFRIRTDPLHGDSSALHQALYEAAQRDLISLDNPEFQDLRLKIPPDVASSFLRDLPGKPEMYRWLAKRFTEHYAAVV